ncbi:hypothetical protein METBIDRAFT_38691 [Metschnikowia bicuspidata var. bicuspidata NRRL YB-4993]|uniref:Uncharacterized protein n=1 Tax=Metschnikowia bicuspidata var. bicuspidata NRRL YB-4993 TaxID=869754 RepID=A0A1A0HEM0_9ASCO|nr:hypothetical protein METBIDRAFT_38691 [Metschnikowia bicuspidata var. bicuspidata NRRL YB-4993]OBA22358.1 hypothetical protein METBIDRAFT_38691 [Metschnikowia bicuspidata var. bicuspidata NRRL YB-4993]
MSQYQPNAAPGRSFMEKINSKFSSLSVASSLLHSDKDGSSEDDTLIHKALVNFYESRNEPFPEWLGVKEHVRKRRGRHPAAGPGPDPLAPATTPNSRFQPVRASYNSVQQPQNSGTSAFSAPASREASVPDSEPDERPYARRTNSRLQQMYNKTRQNSLPGSGYSSLSPAPQPALISAGSRGNSSGQRLRDRVMHGGSYSGESSSRPTWGN